MSRLPINLPPAEPGKHPRGRLGDVIIFCIIFCLAFTALFAAALLVVKMMLG